MHARAARLRAFIWFLLAAVFTAFAQQFAGRTAPTLVNDVLNPLLNRLILLVMLLAGFAAMSKMMVGRQRPPLADIGLPRRPGAGGEWALGAALGWAGITVCVLPIALAGALVVTVSHVNAGTIGALALDVLTLLLAALTDELIFRGFPFQRLLEALGTTLGTSLMALLFTLAHTGFSVGSGGGVLATLLLGFLLGMAYLRTRALWMGWGFHFAWNASMAMLFGLPISGLTGFSPVFSSYTSGYAWLTGGGYGPEGSALAVLVLLVLLFVMARVTRELRYRWAMPPIVGAGLAVDINGMSQRQHAQGMGPVVPAPAGASLVQIAPASASLSMPQSGSQSVLGERSPGEFPPKSD